ncbi:MAG: hypothetical protein ROO71_13010 [Balneola sp.]
MSNQLSKLLIDSIEEVERKDGSGVMPVIKITGITFSTSESGNSSFTRRTVNVPLNKLNSKAEAEQFFKPGSVLEGFELYKKPCEEYEYEAPTGETYLLNYNWSIRKAGENEPTAKKLDGLEREVFSGAKSNGELEPQI